MMNGLSISIGLGARNRGAAALIKETYGALSRAQPGAGIATTATAIVSGDPLGHWQIGSGRLYPSTAGDTANMSGGPYLLALDNGQIVNITIEADTWDVATQAEWDVISLQAAGTLAGKTIALRNDSLLDLKITGAAGTAFRRASYLSGGTPLTIKGRFGAVGDWDSYCEINQVATLRGAIGIRFQHLRTAKTATAKFVIVGEGSFPVDAITIHDCDISGQVADPNGDYTTSTNYPNFSINLVTTVGSAAGSVGSITLTNCRIQWGRNNVQLSVDRSGGTLTISGNEIRYFYEDAIKVSRGSGAANCPATVSSNFITDPVGLPTDSAAIHPDAIQFIGANTAPADWTGHLVENNIIVQGTARGVMQSILMDDMKTSGGDSGFFYTATVRNNLIVNNITQGSWVSQAKNCVIDNNTVVSWNLAATVTPSILCGTGSANATNGGGNTATDNIADSLNIVSGSTVSNNFTTGRNGSTIAYSTLFAGPTFAPVSFADAIANFTPLPAANGAGASL